MLSIQTAPSHPRPSYSFLASPVHHASSLINQSHSPISEPAFKIDAEDTEPSFTIQNDPPYPEPLFTTLLNADDPAQATMTIQIHSLYNHVSTSPSPSPSPSPNPTFTINQSQEQRYTIQTENPQSVDVYTMHVRVGTPGVNIPTGVPYPPPSYMIITRPVPSSSSSPSPSPSASPSASSSRVGSAITNKSKKHCHASRTREPTYTIQTSPPYPVPFSVNGPGPRRYSAQADVPLELITSASSSTTVNLGDQGNGGWGTGTELRRNLRESMPMANTLPPAPTRHRWSKHCPPICPPDNDDEVKVELEGQSIEETEIPAILVDDVGDRAEVTMGVDVDVEAEAEAGAEDEENEEHKHEDSTWPDPCHSPFCFLAAQIRNDEPGTRTEPSVEELGNRLPRGCLVRGEARMGSVHLNL